MASVARRTSSSGWPRISTPKMTLVGAAILVVLLAAITIEMFLMLQEMHQLASGLPSSASSVNRLEIMRSDLDRMQPDLHQVNAHLNVVQGNTTGLQDSLQKLATEVATLDRDVQQLQADLKDIDQHVANVDRKTGPTPPGPIP